MPARVGALLRGTPFTMSSGASGRAGTSSPERADGGCRCSFKSRRRHTPTPSSPCAFALRLAGSACCHVRVGSRLWTEHRGDAFRSLPYFTIILHGHLMLTCHIVRHTDHSAPPTAPAHGILSARRTVRTRHVVYPRRIVTCLNVARLAARRSAGPCRCSRSR